VTRWNDAELARIAKVRAENRKGRAAEPGTQPDRQGPKRAEPGRRERARQPKSELLVEVLVKNLSGYKRGDRVVLDHMTPGQVACLVESGAVRPVEDERPSEADELKEASDG
jgi:hypothetical protein